MYSANEPRMVIQPMANDTVHYLRNQASPRFIPVKVMFGLVWTAQRNTSTSMFPFNHNHTRLASSNAFSSNNFLCGLNSVQRTWEILETGRAR